VTQIATQVTNGPDGFWNEDYAICEASPLK